MAVIDDVAELDKPTKPNKRRMPKAGADSNKAVTTEPAAAGQQSDIELRMKRVLLTSPKGGCGKTELTKHLAVAAAISGLNVAVVDFDRQRTLTRWWKRRSESMTQIEVYEGNMAAAREVYDVNGHDLL